MIHCPFFFPFFLSFSCSPFSFSFSFSLFFSFSFFSSLSGKPQIESQIVVSDYHQMDKILKEERQYILEMCKKIKKSNCNVLLIQKSILRDAVNDLALHYLSKLKILVIKDIERDEIEFISKVLSPFARPPCSPRKFCQLPRFFH